MTAIWRNDGAGWQLLAPVGFPDEAALHNLVEQAPQVLPLAGTPRLTVVGREVALGNGYADLLAVEPTGRLVIIEVKLARNAEARRAVVAQVLSYAAHLHGMDIATLEHDTVGRYLRDHGQESLASAVAAGDQEAAFDSDVFAQGLEESLAQGRFRLVLILDDAPLELVRLVGYLETVTTDRILVDLITVSAYSVDGNQILVPQRVDSERGGAEKPRPAPPLKSGGWAASGADDFVAAIEQAPEEHRTTLRQLAEWATALERDGLVRLLTYHGKSGRLTLLPRLRADDAGLVTIWNDGGAYLSLWRSVFERRAPQSLRVVEQLIAPTPVGNGNTIRAISAALLDALTAAYREAVHGETA